MERCDALVVGGGPAGSTCAWSLRRHGLDVLVLDRARFPRDKPCAGWLTPQAVTALALDLDEYAQGRVLQPVTGISAGRIGDAPVLTRYRDVVSYGVRRCEFDHYLLQRSRARVRAERVTAVRRAGDGFVVNESIRTPLLIGAGGHFCPVARALGAGSHERPLVVAQEIELLLPPAERERCPVDPCVPELYFCRDLSGYGWVFRKGDYVNVGFGRRDTRGFPGELRDFARFLRASARVRFPERWPGHAYLIYEGAGREAVHDAALLIGDSAGLAYAQSGEGIGPAIESGLLAARAALAAGGHYTRARLRPYADALARRFGARPRHAPLRFVPQALRSWIGARLLLSPRANRRLVVDRWFLHRGQPPLCDSAELSAGAAL
jgi:flavin-dependent dehydrogenase